MSVRNQCYLSLCQDEPPSQGRWSGGRADPSSACPPLSPSWPLEPRSLGGGCGGLSQSKDGCGR